MSWVENDFITKELNGKIVFFNIVHFVDCFPQSFINISQQVIQRGSNPNGGDYFLHISHVVYSYIKLKIEIVMVFGIPNGFNLCRTE